MKFIIVLDGADHKAKEIEHRHRSKNRKDAQAKLEELYSDGFENTIPDIESLRKKVVYPRDQNIVETVKASEILI